MAAGRRVLGGRRAPVPAQDLADGDPTSRRAGMADPERDLESRGSGAPTAAVESTALTPGPIGPKSWYLRTPLRLFRLWAKGATATVASLTRQGVSLRDRGSLHARREEWVCGDSKR